MNDLVAFLSGQGVDFWLENGELRFRGPEDKTKLPEFQEVRDRKPELLRYLNGLARNSIPPVSHVASTDGTPATIAQRFWWEIVEKRKALGRFLAFAGILKGSIEADLIERETGKLVQRHGVLRTRFKLQAGILTHDLQDQWSGRLERIDLEASGGGLDDVTSILERVITTSIDIENGPVFRALLLQLSGDERVLILSAHPMTVDLGNWGQLVGELLISLGCARDGTDSPLPPPSLTFQDFARWEAEWVSGPNLKENSLSWGQRAQGFGHLDLPYLKGANTAMFEEVRSYQRRSEIVAMSKDVHRTVREIANRWGYPVPVILIAILLIFLARWTGRRELLLSHFAGGRPPGMDGVLGSYMIPRPMSAIVPEGATFLEFVAQVRYSFAVLHGVTHAVDAETQLTGPFLQVVASVIQTGEPADGPTEFAAGLTFENLPQPDEVADEIFNHIGFYFQETPINIELMVGYAAPLFGQETICAACAELMETAGQVVADPLAPLGRVLTDFGTNSPQSPAT